MTIIEKLEADADAAVSRWRKERDERLREIEHERPYGENTDAARRSPDRLRANASTDGSRLQRVRMLEANSRLR